VRGLPEAAVYRGSWLALTRFASPHHAGRESRPRCTRLLTAVPSPSESDIEFRDGSGTIPGWAAPPAIRPPTATPCASATPASADEPETTSCSWTPQTAADCREVVIETASTRTDRPKLRQALAVLKPGDTLVIYKPDRVARSMKELLVLLEDQLHAREINLHILTGICAGLHRPTGATGATGADKMLFMVAAMAAEMKRDLIRERTLDGLAAAHTQGRRGGRPSALDADTLAVASPAAPAANPSPPSPGTSASADPPCTGHSANLSPPETDPPTRLTARSILFR